MKTRIFLISLVAVLTAVFLSSNVLAAPELSLVYYDGHMHTWRSDGSGTVDQIKTTALSRGLSAVVITDHCYQLTKDEWDSLVAACEAASDENFIALPGFEVTGQDGIFNRAHVNALGVDDPFVGNDEDCLCPEEVWPNPQNPYGTGALYPENITKWVDYIHSKGGIAVHNHPSGTTIPEYGVNNMEIYNESHVDDVIGYAKLLGYSEEEAWQFGITLNNFAIYGERDVNMLVPFPGMGYIPLRYALFYATQFFPPYIGQWLGAPEAPLNSWDDLLMAYVEGYVERPIFGLANSDDHNTADLDCADGSCSKVGVAKNGVYIKNSLSANELYKAIKAGRTFATTGPSLALDVNGELMGDTTYIFDGSADINLSVNSESLTAVLVKIDIIKNGDLLQTIYPSTPTDPAWTYADALEDMVDEDGYYRIEITTQDMISGGYQFAWSNPVFVRIPD